MHYCDLPEIALKGVGLEDLLGAGPALCNLDGVGTLDEEGRDNFVGVADRKEIAVQAGVRTGVLSPAESKQNDICNKHRSLLSLNLINAPPVSTFRRRVSIYQ